jgi:hypothetical protein
MQFWFPCFEKLEFLIPYFKSQLFDPSILIFSDFWSPTQFDQIFGDVPSLLMMWQCSMSLFISLNQIFCFILDLTHLYKTYL